MKDRLHQRFAEELARAPLHSPLGMFMQEHRTELRRMLRGKRPGWDAWSLPFGAAGLKDHGGKAPSAETVKATWEMVRKQRGA